MSTAPRQPKPARVHWSRGIRRSSVRHGHNPPLARSAVACLSTAGDLVFQGQADGYITGYSASEGRRVWAFYSATAALGAPISFAIGKRQYISILNGPTQGAAGSLGLMSARFGWDSRVHPRRLLTFVLDGTGELPPTPRPTYAQPIDGAGFVVEEAKVKQGAKLFAKCQWCHGAGAIAGGGAPDLRASFPRWFDVSFATLVRGGNEMRGMPKFAELSDGELEALRHYIRAQARKVTRPGGVAPPEPQNATPEPPPPPPAPEDDKPKPPPGSLESSRVRRPPPEQDSHRYEYSPGAGLSVQLIQWLAIYCDGSQ